MTLKHYLTGMEFCASEQGQLIDLAIQLKADRLAKKEACAHKHLAMVFDKESFRTRTSFTVAMRELGGDVIESIQSNRKSEDPEDQIRVLQGYVHAVMVRLSSDKDMEDMVKHATVPVINALSDLYHPCQILADLMTLKERFGSLEGLHLCYLGDGNNILHSLMLQAPMMGVTVHYCCPPQYGPHARTLKTAIDLAPDHIIAHTTPQEAVAGCHALYTDVWSSMGFDPRDESAFDGYQINKELMSHAQDDAVVMHCMPMERGKEVCHRLPDEPCSVIFQQAENRLHAQKALLYTLLGDKK